MPIIERYFSSDDDLVRISNDFRGLIANVNRSHGELSIQLRQNYFNIYYKGNSLARIEPLKNGGYSIRTHRKFVKGPVEKAWSAFTAKDVGAYRQWVVDGGDVRRFLSKTNIINLGRQISKVNHGEEITFEQILMTDNPPSLQLIIIDRQIADHSQGKQMDMLALTRPNKTEPFRFLVIEVKLGKNPQLRDSVATQLNDYVDHLRDYIDDYIACYTRNYSQKYRLGLLDFDGAESSINIDPIVDGVVVVGGYSGIAVDAIKELKTNHPDIQVMEMRNSLL